MNPSYFNSPGRLAQAASSPDPAIWAGLGYSTLLIGTGILGGALVGAGWGFLTSKKGPSTQDFVTGAIGGAGVGVGMLISQALRRGF